MREVAWDLLGLTEGKMGVLRVVEENVRGNLLTERRAWGFVEGKTCVGVC